MRTGGPERREAIADLLSGNRALEELHERIAEARTAYEAVLLDGAAEARRLMQEGGGLPLAEAETTEDVDAFVEALRVRAFRAAGRIQTTEADLVAATGKLEEHRELLDSARRVLVEQEPEVPEITELPPERLEPPAAGEEDVDVPEPDVVSDEDAAEPGIEVEATPAPPERVVPVVVPLSDAERELIELQEDGLRIDVIRLERHVELDRLRKRSAGIAREVAALPGPVIDLQLERWGVRREAVAAREQGGLLNVTVGLLDLELYFLGYDHARALWADPAAVREQVRARVLSGREGAAGPQSPRGLFLGVVLLGILLTVLGRRVRPMLLAWRPRDRGDALGRAALLAALPLIPASGVCALLAWTDAVPPALIALFSFGAIAPVTAAVVVALADHLFVAGGETTAGAARYLRTMVRLGTGLASSVLVAASVLPLFGFPAAVRARVGELLIGLLVVNWVLLSIQRQALLEVIGATGDPQKMGVLRAGIRRLYQAFVGGPVIVFVLHALGYQNLASFLVRGGLITLGVLLFAPWVYSRMASLLKAAFGYPNGGGWLALSPQASKAAVRTIAPLLMLLFVFITVSLIASGWGYGDLGANLVNAITWPLLKVGGSRISAGSLLLLSVTISGTVLVSRWVITLLRTHVYPLYDLDAGMRATVDTLTRYMIIGVGSLVSLDAVGVGTGVITVFAGVIGIGLGFGSQTLLANFMAGVILLVARPVAVDSVIEVGGIIGRVVRISGYATVIRTLDNVTVIVPNAEIINTHVVNWNIDTPHVRLQLVVGVAYGSDTTLVKKLLKKAASEHPQVLVDPPPIVRFDDFGDSALLFTLLPWTWDIDGRYVIASDLRFRIDELFKENGVEIPFPQRDLHIRTGDGTVQLGTVEIATQKGWEVRPSGD
jgi:small-conductance mechanosensitive channel